MPIIAGIDIGTRNLALCVVSLNSIVDLTDETPGDTPTTFKKASIIHWSKTDLTGYTPPMCSSCSKRATTVSSTVFHCGHHTPKSLRFLKDNGKKFTSSPKAKEMKAFLRQQGKERESKATTASDLRRHVMAIAAFPLFKPKFKSTSLKLSAAIDTWIHGQWEHLRQAAEIIIENQPPAFNNPMKKVQDLVHTRLQAKFDSTSPRAISHSTTIRLVNGRSRGARTYYEHKKEATRRATTIVSGTSWELWLNAQLKKDDFADSLLLAVDHGTLAGTDT